MSMAENKQNHDDRAGVQESHQDKRQDDVAKQRQGQQDQKLRDAHTRKPERKDGTDEPA